jgi:mannose-6-phosphate isomerase-like protein (cupin superfamily)
VSVQLPETPNFLIEETKKKVAKRVTPTPVVKIPATATLLQKELAKFDEEARIEEEYKKKNRERAERKKAELAMRSQAAVEALRAVKAAEAAQIEALKKQEIQREEEEKKRQAELSAGLSWKTLLSRDSDKESTQFERDWGLLCERARGLAPETNWYFLLMNANDSSFSVVANWRNWLERFICSFDWHSPRDVEVVFNIENGRGVFTMSWKKAELPPPLFVNLMDWTVHPVTVNERAGFKMTYTGSFISDKAGIA